MREIITSPQNKFIKLAVALKQKKYREELNLFVVEGVRLVEEAVQATWLIDTCIYTAEALEHERVQKIISTLQAKECHIIQVPRAIYDKITDTQEPQGIMAIVKKCTYGLEDLLKKDATPFIMVLDELQDPGNMGTIIRTAVAAGCTGVILTKGCTDIFASKAVRGSMGSVFHVPIVSGLTTDEVISFLKKQDIEIFATALESSDIYFKVDFTKALAIVFGNEGNGVNKQFLTQAQQRLYIPLIGPVESLNVAASAAVILYEVVRQRQ